MRKKKLYLAAVNVLLVAMGVCFAIFYSRYISAERTVSARDAFASTVGSMRQVSLNYLEAQQEMVNSSGAYLEEEKMTVDAAMDVLGGLDNDESSFHLLDLETMIGYSTKASVLDETNYTVDYTIQSEDFQNALRAMADADSEEDTLKVTENFPNPIDGATVVGFGRMVELDDGSGGQKSYLLLKIVPLSAFQESWVFPTSYEKAEIGLITSTGEYIVRTNAMKSENFLEFIRAYNNMTYPERDALQEEMKRNDSGVLEYQDARGQDAYWAYTTMEVGSYSWLLVGYVPVETIETDGSEWTMVFVVCALFITLLAVDGIYLLSLNRQLRESVKSANLANEAKTRFLSSMSHDIRTPMNAITGMTEIALRHMDDRDRVQDCLDKITLASDHLLTLINDILDISRVESGRLVMNPTVFSLPDMITNLANMIRPQAHAKQLEFNVRVFPLTREYLYADKLRLNQIFINILSNAVKYTPDGGRVMLTLKEQCVADSGDAVLVYTVTDTGIGMTPEFMESMFEPFTRAEDSRISTGTGAGLGLAITKQMVDAMEGTIEVESELGKGTTFRVTLTLPTSERVDETSSLPPMRMLVADDDPVFLETVTDTLETLGTQADTASGGADAVSMAVRAHQVKEDYSVIILDWKMPEVDGVMATRAIREQVGHDVPIIILSAFDWTDIEEEAREAGVTGFINKPVFRSTLYAKVMELLGLRQEKNTTPENPAEELRGMHLLVAEDNDLNWEIAQELLSCYGITAERAENGAVCVKMLTEAPPDTYEMVIMDIQMPVLNGWDAARQIRASALPHVKKIPIIAMTADAFAEDVRTSMEAGMNGHVSKPIDMKLLLEQIKRIRREVSQ